MTLEECLAEPIRKRRLSIFARHRLGMDPRDLLRLRTEPQVWKWERAEELLVKVQAVIPGCKFLEQKLEHGAVLYTLDNSLSEIRTRLYSLETHAL